MGKEDSKKTAIYIAIGILLAVGLNYGMGVAMATGYPIVAVESNSMVPTFARGDILIIKGTTPDELKQGDTIVFTVPGKPVPIVHRVVAKNPDGTVQTKGDANAGQHPWETRINPDQIKGKEVLILPLLGWVKIGITEVIIPNISIIVVVVVILTFIYLLTNKKERKPLFKKKIKSERKR